MQWRSICLSLVRWLLPIKCTVAIYLPPFELCPINWPCIAMVLCRELLLINGSAQCCMKRYLGIFFILLIFMLDMYHEAYVSSWMLCRWLLKKWTYWLQFSFGMIMRRSTTQMQYCWQSLSATSIEVLTWVIRLSFRSTFLPQSKLLVL